MKYVYPQPHALHVHSCKNIHKRVEFVTETLGEFDQFSLNLSEGII